jgi:hypothetical protein
MAALGMVQGGPGMGHDISQKRANDKPWHPHGTDFIGVLNAKSYGVMAASTRVLREHLGGLAVVCCRAEILC